MFCEFMKSSIIKGVGCKMFIEEKMWMLGTLSKNICFLETVNFILSIKIDAIK